MENFNNRIDARQDDMHRTKKHGDKEEKQGFNPLQTQELNKILVKVQ